MRESLKDKLESALSTSFEQAQEAKIAELNRLSTTGKQIPDLYRELGLEYPSGKPIISPN